MGLAQNTVIICDSCNSDISPKITSYPHEYILKLSAFDVAEHSENGAIYSIMMVPPLEKDLYFCGLECVRNYLKDKI